MIPPKPPFSLVSKKACDHLCDHSHECSSIHLTGAKDGQPKFGLKVRVTCLGCGKKFKFLPNAILLTDDEDRELKVAMEPTP